MGSPTPRNPYLDNFPAALAHVVGKPRITDADRAELTEIQAELEQIFQRYAAVIAKYDRADIAGRVDARFLPETSKVRLTLAGAE